MGVNSKPHDAAKLDLCCGRSQHEPLKFDTSARARISEPKQSLLYYQRVYICDRPAPSEAHNIGSWRGIDERSRMMCCTGYCAAAAQFDSKRAERDLRRYRRRGAEATTRLLVAGLRRWPLEGRCLLDVGGGIGVISRELANTRLASATIVEASPAYLEVGRREVGLKFGARPVQFVLGDFAVLAGKLPDADVVTLDRVACCYPDAEALLVAAAAHTRQVLAFTYPRNRWYVRTMFALASFWLRLTGKKFRAFVHAPERMAAVLEAAGLVRALQRETLVWMLDVYHRDGVR
jgi:2-polyprenyl-3-methyl-5-hydroxy-6-metoxy-1,4-benzoquinol methylase